MNKQQNFTDEKNRPNPSKDGDNTEKNKSAKIYNAGGIETAGQPIHQNPDPKSDSEGTGSGWNDNEKVKPEDKMYAEGGGNRNGETPNAEDDAKSQTKQHKEDEEDEEENIE